MTYPYMIGYKKKFEFIRNLLLSETVAGLTILEVGAHFGEDTARFLEILGNQISKVYCFEPDPRSVLVFRDYINDDRVTLSESALSDKNGVAPFFQSFDPEQQNPPKKYGWIPKNSYQTHKLGNSGSSSLKPGYHLTLQAPIHVTTRRFDDWALQHKVETVDFAWIDVQGSEKEVINGMGHAISKVKFFWIEFGEQQYEGAMSRQETIDLMRIKGFQFVPNPFTSTDAESGDALFRRL